MTGLSLSAELRERNPSDPTRRKLLRCMADWAGTGVLWTLVGGVPMGTLLAGDPARAVEVPSPEGLRFAQISDTHIGFNKAANPDVTATARAAVDLINAQADATALAVHTGDLTHLAKPTEFDAVAQILQAIRVPELHLIPGEHDVFDEGRSAFLARYGKASGGKGWYAFDHAGVHFVALVNVMDFEAGGQGRLGAEQIRWLTQDLAGRPASQPLVLFSHIPLWSLYPQWGWSTEDWPQALDAVKRFGSVTVLNGHIHQVVQKVEGNLRYFTAHSTAYPQPAAGQAEGPGPLQVPAERLRSVLGVRRIEVAPLAGVVRVVETTLDAAPVAGGSA